MENDLKLPIFKEPLFVGKKPELQQLQQLLDTACTGNGATVFVFGEAGAGKSRLVKELLKSIGE